MNIAIVDDELEVRDTLVEYVSRFAKGTGVKMDTITFCSGDELLAEYKHIYDIIIFDIDMPGTNGIDSAKKIREMDKNVTIIFITNVAQYAINGYEVDAVDYIIKPVNYNEFSMKFYRTVAKAAQKSDNVILVDTIEGHRKIRVSSIYYVEVQAHYIYIHTDKRNYKARGNMREWEELLRPYNFIRVYKSYLVNMNYIEEIQGNDIIIAGNSVPLGRGYKTSFMQAYMKYFRGD